MTGARNTTVCFSGHRSYVPAPEDEARLAAAIGKALADGYRIFVSGMAPGFDLAAGEAVIRARDPARTGDGAATREADGVSGHHPDIRLVAAIPFVGQPHGYSEDERRRYDALLAAADEVRVLADRYSHGCYYRRDEWMVERAGRLICRYDGSPGGTRYTVRCAIRRGLEIVNTFRAPGSLF